MKKLYRIDPCCRCLCATCQRGQEDPACCTKHHDITCVPGLPKGEPQACPNYIPKEDNHD